MTAIQAKHVLPAATQLWSHTQMRTDRSIRDRIDNGRTMQTGLSDKAHYELSGAFARATRCEKYMEAMTTEPAEKEEMPLFQGVVQVLSLSMWPDLGWSCEKGQVWIKLGLLYSSKIFIFL